MPLDIESRGPDHRWVAKREIVLPTLPSFTAIAGSGDRALLLAGLTFVEGAASGWTTRDLVQWFGANAMLLGWGGAPPSVTEAAVGTIALQSGVRRAGDRAARADELPTLLVMARWKVAVTLRGLLYGDDRFLEGAIFSGRVRRDAKASAWRARPRESDSLSAIILSLFVADVLAYRDFHEASLCVCDVCGRISYNPLGTTRAGCPDHLPAWDPGSAAHPAGQPDLARSHAAAPRKR